MPDLPDNAPASALAPAPVPVIIDTDPGVDDALAILMALAAPALNVIGVTATAGNVPLARATRNALALLEYAGRCDIPVYRGAARPVRGRYAYAREVHSAAGLTYPIPNPTTAAAGTGAVSYLAETLRARPGEVAVIALGPLTNLARLLRRHPDALPGAARIIIMGGAVNARGNVTPDAEFNFYSDPTAARIVMESGLPMTLVDLGACRQVYLARADGDDIGIGTGGGNGGAGGRRATLAAGLLAGWFRRDPARERFHLYDPLAVIAALEPAILRLRPVTLAIDDADATGEAGLWGRCRVVDENAGPVSVAAPDGVDSAAALAAIRSLLAGGGAER